MGPALLGKDVVAESEDILLKGVHKLECDFHFDLVYTALKIYRLMDRFFSVHIVLFTTGRGTPFASPVPTVKISSNSTLAGKKKNWIDFNAGVLVEDAELEETGQKLFDYVIDVASGKKVRSEEAGFHDMAIFKQGVTL